MRFTYTSQARISFAFIYPDRHGRNVLRQVGQVRPAEASRGSYRRRIIVELSFELAVLTDHAPAQVFGGSHRRSDDDNKQLAQLNFQTGDFLSVAIFQS